MADLIHWSPEAVDDLDSLVRYIARDSDFYARAVAVKILDTASGLWEHPRLGRVVPEFGDDAIRERFVYSYRLIYRIEAERILLLAVAHGRRLLEEVASRLSPER